MMGVWKRIRQGLELPLFTASIFIIGGLLGWIGKDLLIMTVASIAEVTVGLYIGYLAHYWLIDDNEIASDSTRISRGIVMGAAAIACALL